MTKGKQDRMITIQDLREAGRIGMAILSIPGDVLTHWYPRNMHISAAVVYFTANPNHDYVPDGTCYALRDQSGLGGMNCIPKAGQPKYGLLSVVGGK